MSRPPHPQTSLHRCPCARLQGGPRRSPRTREVPGSTRAGPASAEPAGVGGLAMHLWRPPWRGGTAVATLALCLGSQGEAEGS